MSNANGKNIKKMIFWCWIEVIQHFESAELTANISEKHKDCVELQFTEEGEWNRLGVQEEDITLKNGYVKIYDTYKHTVWQRNFFEHGIRDEDVYPQQGSI